MLTVLHTLTLSHSDAWRAFRAAASCFGAYIPAELPREYPGNIPAALAAVGVAGDRAAVRDAEESGLGCTSMSVIVGSGYISLLFGGGRSCVSLTLIAVASPATVKIGLYHAVDSHVDSAGAIESARLRHEAARLALYGRIVATAVDSHRGRVDVVDHDDGSRVVAAGDFTAPLNGFDWSLLDAATADSLRSQLGGAS